MERGVSKCWIISNGNTSYKSTDFIPVVAGDVYCTNIVFLGRREHFIMILQKQLLEAVYPTSGTSFTVPSGTGIAFIRLCTTNAIYTQVEASTLPPYLVHAVSLSAAGGYPPTVPTTTIDSRATLTRLQLLLKQCQAKLQLSLRRH